MNTLPNEVCQHIAGFMDYTTRVSYNSALPYEDGLYKRLNSDSHNLQIKINHMQHLVDTFNLTKYSFENSLYDQAIRMIQLLKYLAHTKDTVLFEYSTEAFRTTLRGNVQDQIESLGRLALPGRVKQDIQRLCEQIQIKLDRYPFVKPIKAERIQIR